MQVIYFFETRSPSNSQDLCWQMEFGLAVRNCWPMSHWLLSAHAENARLGFETYNNRLKNFILDKCNNLSTTFFGDRRRGSSPWISPLRSLRFFCGAFTVENQTRISLWNLTRAGGGNLWALQLSCDSIAEIAHVIQIFYQSMMNCPRNPHTSPGTKMKGKRLVEPFSHAFYSLFMQILYFVS